MMSYSLRVTGASICVQLVLALFELCPWLSYDYCPWGWFAHVGFFFFGVLMHFYEPNKTVLLLYKNNKLPQQHHIVLSIKR